MGRTGSSWGKIGLFYVVYFSFLAGWFAVMMTAFYQTLDTEHSPTYTPGKDGGSILQNIAMGYRPLAPANNIESTLIWYKHDDTEDVKHWVNNLNAFVEPYKKKDTSVKYVPCSETVSADPTKGEVCDFSLSSFGTHCSSANSWGYPEGKPCVLLKLNKMMNWEPEVYETMKEVEDSKMPKSLKTHIQSETKLNNGTVPAMIWTSCIGKYDPDADEMGPIEYIPKQGFQKMYFPYANTHGYRAPLVAVMFKNPRHGVVVNIECRAWAKNIEQNRGKRFGLIDFELLID